MSKFAKHLRRSCSLLVRVDLAAGEFARELSTGIVLLDVDELKVAYVAFGETASVLVHAGLLETPRKAKGETTMTNIKHNRSDASCTAAERAV
jgi:hypothetical protein